MSASAIVWALISLGGGFIGGALSRQPEINKLKEQVRTLQNEVNRLNRLIDEQNRQINVLKTKYHALKGVNLIEEAKSKNQLKGAITYSYCLKEYLDLNYRITAQEYLPSENENAFLQIFKLILDGAMPAGDEGKLHKYFLREYIREKYSSQIDSLIECDISYSLKRIGEME